MHSVPLKPASQPEVTEEVYLYNAPFSLEGGGSLPELRIAYTTYGTLSEKKDNVIWVAHALTANANPAEWWPGLIGEGCIINPEEHFIVCANILGSCYGTTGPGDVKNGSKAGLDFPAITIRDMVNAHVLLRKHLNIDTIALGIGGSMGGQQLLEWAVLEPHLIKKLCVIATNARHSAWGIAFNTAQRMALEADPTFFSHTAEGGKKGLEAARAIGMLSYRNQQTYNATQTDEEARLDQYKAESYQRYQGQKLSKRFDAHAYYYLSKAMDSHHLGRDRGSLEEVLASIKSDTLVIGIATDLLFPVTEQEFIAKHIPRASFAVISSFYGHDGFLIEAKELTEILRAKGMA
jgi:homoserine O-acetyltransferase